MHRLLKEMCTCVHISVSKWCILGHFFDALWNLWDGSIGNMKMEYDRDLNLKEWYFIWRKRFMPVISANQIALQETLHSNGCIKFEIRLMNIQIHTLDLDPSRRLTYSCAVDIGGDRCANLLCQKQSSVWMQYVWSGTLKSQGYSVMVFACIRGQLADLHMMRS